jgi:hypothetical protein
VVNTPLNGGNSTDAILHRLGKVRFRMIPVDGLDHFRQFGSHRVRCSLAGNLFINLKHGDAELLVGIQGFAIA